MKRRYRRTAVVVLIALTATLGGLAASEARRDTTPPKLYIEPLAPVEAGTTAKLTITANEPVTYQVRYGSVNESKVTQNWTVALTAMAGSQPVDIVATDGAGNRTEEQVLIDGVARPHPEVHSLGELRAGEPLDVTVSWSPGGATVTGVAVDFGGRAQRVIHGLDGARSIVPVALSTRPGSYTLTVDVTDEFGVVHTITRSIAVTPLVGKVAYIPLAPKVLAQDNPESAAIEQQAFDTVFAKTTPTPDWSAPFELPVQGRISSGFGSARRFVPGGPVSYHTGVDLAVPAGTPIHAANDGVVALARHLPISGNVVAIDHGAGVTSFYFHQSKILVHVGEQVKRGQVIGLVGSTGLSSGPHLHFEVRVNGTPTDPLAWVGHRFP